jgi:hypothetical protein
MLYKEVFAYRRALGIYLIPMFALGLLTMYSVGHTAVHPVKADLNLDLIFQTAWLAAIFAIILACNLGVEAGAMARFALMLPARRATTAMQIAAVGIAGSLLAFLLGAVAMYGPAGALYSHSITWSAPLHWESAALPLTFILAIYGITAACGIALRRAPLLAALVAPALMAAWFLVMGLGRDVQSLQFLNYINPFAYYIPGGNIAIDPHMAAKYYGAFGHFSVGFDCFVMALMGIVGLTVALVLWQRLEA